jgi:hypothetical protein
MRRRGVPGGDGKSSDLLLKPPEKAAERPAPREPSEHSEARKAHTKALHRRALGIVHEAMRNVRRRPRELMVRLLSFLLYRGLPLTLVLGGLVYDASTHPRTWRCDVDMYAAVFLSIFAGLWFLWGRY